MKPLNKDVPFHWDDQAQRSFEALEKDLTTTSLLNPPDFSKYFILYLAASDTTIRVVLVQEDES